MKSITGISPLLVCASFFLAGGCDRVASDSVAEKTNPTFMQLAKDRFSVRYYAKTPVEQEKIDAILGAARIAPTAKNLQPFHIYVLKSAEAISKINKLSRCAYEAPVVFVVCYDRSKAWVSPFDANDNSGVMDTSIVGTHMMLEATEACDFIRCLSVRFFKNTEKKFLQRAMEVVGHLKKGVPFFFNDDVMIPRGDLGLKENDIVVMGAVDPERSEHVALREITLKSRNPWNGHAIRDLDISRKTVIVMVKRAGKTLIPKGDLKLQDGDRVFLYSKAQIPDSIQHLV